MNPDLSTYNFARDGAGRATHRWDKLGRELFYTWDDADHLLAMDAVGGGWPSESFTFTYDAMGRRLTSSAPATQLTLTYDLDGLVTSRQTTTPPVSVTYERNDPRGLLTAHQGELWWGFERDALGRRAGWDLENGLALAWRGYDAAGRLSLVWNPPTQADLDAMLQGPTPTTLADLPPLGRAVGYVYGGGHRLGFTLEQAGQPQHSRSLTRLADGRVGTLSDTLLGDQAYTYDDAGRLVGALYTLPDGTQRSYSFAYDLGGNRTQRTVDGVTTTYTISGFNRLVSATDPSGTTTWIDDAMGRPLQKQSPNGQLTAYAYDGWGRLQTVTLPDGTVASYEYDTWGERVAKHVTPPGGAPVDTYFYRDDTVAYEFDDQGALVRATGFESDGTTPVWLAQSGQVYLYQTDHLGTPVLVTDLVGTIVGKTVWAARYAPYGRVEPVVATIEQPWRLPGQYEDPETGLHYNRQRYYDPDTGRFLTPDPIGQEGGLNIYVYAEADPINHSDPLGLSPWHIPQNPCENPPPKKYACGQCWCVEWHFDCCRWKAKKDFTRLKACRTTKAQEEIQCGAGGGFRCPIHPDPACPAVNDGTEADKCD